MIIAAIVALIALVAGIFLLIPKSETTPEPVPTVENPGLDPVINNNEYSAELEKFTASEEMQYAITNYSTYVDWENSNVGDLNPDLVIPMVWGVSKYTEEGFFNPYFVSGYWENKDSFKVNAINEYLAPYLSDSLKAEYTEALKNTDTIKEYFKDKVYIPDSGMTVPTQCAEEWIAEECFRIPSVIDSITVQGTGPKSATLTVNSTMHTNYQNPSNVDGVLTDQERKYSITFDVTFDNAEFRNLSVTDVKINKVGGSLDITNTDDVWSAE